MKTKPETKCADRCGRMVNEANGWEIKNEKFVMLICTACHYKRERSR